MKLKITIEGLPNGPIETETEEGLIMLVKNPHGVMRMMLGKLNVVSLALMMKALISGEEAESKMLRAAQLLANYIDDYKQEAVLDMSPGKNRENEQWLSELMQSIAQKGGQADEP